MVTDSARQLFENELKDVYDAELRLVDALKQLSAKATDDELITAFELHRQQTERQAGRLEGVFRALGAQPAREECEGVKGLIAEFTKFAGEEDPSPEVLNLFAAVAARKTEHYEIVAYESLLSLARQAGLDDTMGALTENLTEEKATAKDLDGLAAKLVAQLPR